MRYRAIPAIAAVLLAGACSSNAATTTAQTSPTAAPAASASASTSPSTAASGPTTPTAAQTAAQAALHTVIKASALPYKPVPGAPTLGDVRVASTAADPCTIPADDSGDEGQLINAQMDVTVLIVTFEFTNPCTKPLKYDFKVIQAIGSEHGPSGGDPLETTTPSIQPGQTIKFNVNLDPKSSLTAAQLQQLWVGIAHISKEPGY